MGYNNYILWSTPWKGEALGYLHKQYKYFVLLHFAANRNESVSVQNQALIRILAFLKSHQAITLFGAIQFSIKAGELI